MISQIGKKKQEEFFLEDIAATREQAFSLAGKLKGGEVICLYGELGSGKTTFVQDLAIALKVPDRINSPTFNILKVYAIKSSKEKIRRIYHVDCYRLEDQADILKLGFKEWIADQEGVVMIEWADKIKNILPAKRIDIYFKIRGTNSRKMIIKY
jgi:tRNA threonylcarbamoyladenosine biosynthesis protein TsaE